MAKLPDVDSLTTAETKELAISALSQLTLEGTIEVLTEAYGLDDLEEIAAQIQGIINRSA